MGRIILGLAMMLGVIGTAILMNSSLGGFLDPMSLVFTLGVVVSGAIVSFPLASLSEALLPGNAMSSEAKARKAVVFHRLADLAVASGMAGTFVGLVMMLQNLDDPSAIGPAMAVALLTLLYGVAIGELWLRGVAVSVLASMGTPPKFSDRRGAVPLYMPLGALFLLLTSFFVMLVAMADY